jgi:thiol peroxidase
MPVSVTHKGKPVHLSGELPAVGQAVPDLRFVRQDLAEGSLKDLIGEVVVLFCLPSVDTGVCATETRTFNQKLAGLGIQGVVVSADLPFALKRFCAAEGIANVQAASDFRHRDMDRFGVRLIDGTLAGLLARVVFIIDRQGVLRYVQVVPEISSEPDYDAVLAEAAKWT